MANKMKKIGFTFDIETGPIEQSKLRSLYREPTYEEYRKSKGKVNWKEETFKSKYQNEFLPNAWSEFVSKASLNPLFGRVLMIGTGFKTDGDGDQSRLVTPSSHISDEYTEQELLESFWGTINRAKSEGLLISGFNIKHFDFPFLVRRSWVLNIKTPHWLGNTRGRFFNYDNSIVDIAEHWACGTGEYTKLDDLCVGLGLKPKLGSGESFFELFLQDAEAAKQYNEDEIMKNLILSDRFCMF